MKSYPNSSFESVIPNTRAKKIWLKFERFFFTENSRIFEDTDWVKTKEKNALYAWKIRIFGSLEKFKGFHNIYDKKNFIKESVSLKLKKSIYSRPEIKIYDECRSQTNSRT